MRVGGYIIVHLLSTQYVPTRLLSAKKRVKIIKKKEKHLG